MAIVPALKRRNSDTLAPKDLAHRRRLHASIRMLRAPLAGSGRGAVAETLRLGVHRRRVQIAPGLGPALGVLGAQE
jgi:hypothetical protein